MLALGSGGGTGRLSVDGVPVGRGFALVYTHSMYKALSAEIFTVEGRRFTMRAVVSASGGVLDYYQLDGARSRTPAGLYVLALATPVTYDALDLIATPVGRRTLLAGHRCLPLYPATGATSVRLALAPSTAGAGGPCPAAYNQSFFLNTVYNATEASATTSVEAQKPQS
ncbi:DUF1850 domain-containing protein [Nonomuraea sp. NBC_01738]|uniref:hypothetical protein n=1 Tax=Nonomuraea sp. NBC_01738 TaxID=2976003 RepID=UPI002E1675DE|nr:DUF1850 domain-containing protein [Nonomuraea sp. NBC_01738]